MKGRVIKYMIDYLQNNKKGILLVLLGLMVIVSLLLFLRKYDDYYGAEEGVFVAAVKPLETQNESPQATTEDAVKRFLVEKDSSITFLSNTFEIDKSLLMFLLEKDFASGDILNTDNFDRDLVNYLSTLEANDKGLFGTTHKPCTDGKDYIVALIKYFCNIYSDVDFSIAAGIASVESTFTAQGMLNRNNIYGGMSSGGLIRYKNIEYGVYKFIKTLNDGYYAKGLNTIALIGGVFNPTVNENGVKVAKPAWVTNVTNAASSYAVYNEDITAEKLIGMKIS